MNDGEIIRLSAKSTDCQVVISDLSAFYPSLSVMGATLGAFGGV
jgi:hypothetical protein